MAEWFLGLHPVWQALIRVILFVLPVFMMIPFIIWYERRLLSWMQDRIGPNRVGNITFSKTSKYVPGMLRGKKIKLFGLLQPIADGVKAFFKEDFAPGNVDRFLYFLAPAVFLFPAFALGGTIPWGPFPMLTPVSDANIGILYILAISSLGVYGVVLAGYSSDNKYSLLGGLRASAQLISYELSMGMALAAIVMVTGSLRPVDMVAAQQGKLWGFVPGFANWNVLTPHGFVAFVIFLICMVAETNRAPFDLPECENELIAGFNTEYSTKKWVLFMMGEYINMIVYSTILATVFFGGWHALPFQFAELAQEYPAVGGLWHFLDFLNGNSFLAPVWFIVKIALMISFYIWARATLPRLRYDQLMNLGWKSLLPIGVANLVVVAIWIVTSTVFNVYVGWATSLLSVGLLYALYRTLNEASKKPSHFATRSVRMVTVAAERKVVEPELAEVVS